MSAIVCCCSSPDCMVNGCALMRKQQESAWYRSTPDPTTGWTCPNCGAGNAPHVHSCPHCGPHQTRYTQTIVQIPNFESEGENHERSSDCIETPKDQEED